MDKKCLPRHAAIIRVSKKARQIPSRRITRTGTAWDGLPRKDRKKPYCPRPDNLHKWNATKSQPIRLFLLSVTSYDKEKEPKGREDRPVISCEIICFCSLLFSTTLLFAASGSDWRASSDVTVNDARVKACLLFLTSPPLTQYIHRPPHTQLSS
ncbi:hypothetical protein B0H63DRAFT_95968 [Podospora didyma]|uniref:Uncharacterized protein n=1 Tax=Podospora didyma TaxID=330526 RepID=A0AAE0NWV2_9PEZI|nr:hypothetical protein B0H63DRAFT_95968 [Podospora didyma]